MDIYNHLIQNKLITPSVAEVLFGDEYDRELNLDVEVLAKTVYETGLFYAALVQAYLTGVAGVKECTVKELTEYGRAARSVYESWAVNASCDLGGKSVFSFLIECTDCAELAMGSVALFASLGEAYDTFNRCKLDDGRSLVNEQKFIDFIAALPLLSCTEIVGDKPCFRFKTRHELEVRCSPFLTFIEIQDDIFGGDLEIVVDKITSNRYVLTSVQKDERGGEFIFNNLKIGGLNSVQQVKKISRKVSEQEHLMLACSAMGIKVQWSGYSGDFAFMKRLADAAYCAISNLLRPTLDPRYIYSTNVMPNVYDLFKGTEIESSLNLDRTLYLTSVEGLIYELFITRGIFKTVYCMLYAPDKQISEQTGKLFDEIMLCFKNEGVLSDEDYELRLEACNKSISEHKEKLEKQIRRGEAKYFVRLSEIYAERRTICLLRSAGIQNDNVVADSEALFSIDDFYDMFKNPESAPREDLKNLLSFLCCFYGALLNCQEGAFSEESYYNAVSDIKEELLSCEQTVEAYFDCFVSIVQKSAYNPVIERYLGRNAICDEVKLKAFRQRILEKLSDEDERRVGEKKGYGMFISYCRRDDEDGKISRFVARCREQGIEPFFDTTDIKVSSDWRQKASDALRNPQMKVVCLFLSKNSIKSENVEYELQIAREIAKRNHPTDMEKRDAFIVPINLEEESASEYINAAWINRDNVALADCIQQFKPFCAKTYCDISGVNSVIEHYYRILNMEKHCEGRVIQEPSASSLDYAISSFFCFLKYGKHFVQPEVSKVDEYFENEGGDLSYCIFPLVASVRETRIKRDNITVIGYEIIRGKGRSNKTANYILSSKKLAADEYYCVPNYKTVGEGCSWMIEPFLISHARFAEKYNKKD